MSNEPEKSQKTEEPSEKKLSDARRKGDVPNSREVGNLASVLATILLAGVFAGPAAERLASALAPLVTSVHDIRLHAAYTDVGRFAADLIWGVAFILSPIFLAFAVGAFASTIGQNALVFSFDRIKPKAERISLQKGLGRMFSHSALIEFAKSLIKVAVVAAVVGVFVAGELESIEAALKFDLAALPERMRAVTLKLLGSVAVVMLLIAVVDLIWRHVEWKQKLRMTKQEVKDEHKQMEGDPHIKARLAEIRRSRGRKRMIAAVPSATVVITNPTHYAVAFKYVREESDAPICVAKGKNKLALQIRAKAQEHGVPVIENAPLARALYASVEEGGALPEEFYEAVAEIINYIYRIGARSLTL